MGKDNDLTVIFLTVNRVPEKWRLYHKEVLLKAVGDYPIITVSSKPMPDMPGENLIQDGPINASNIYVQMLRAAKIATTPFIAIAEDDSLYPREHFECFRPKEDEFAYDMTRWAMFSWNPSAFFWRDRISNLTLIAPRELLIKCLEERFDKYPDGTPEGRTGEVGKERIEKMLRLPAYKFVKFWSTTPVVNVNHVYSLDPREINKSKRMAPLRAIEVPLWGKASDIAKHFI